MSKIYFRLIMQGVRTPEDVKSKVTKKMWEEINALLIDAGYYDIPTSDSELEEIDD